MIDVFVNVPLWVWALVGVALAALAFRFGGWKWAALAGALLAAALGYRHAAKSGWEAKAKRDMRDADKLIEKSRKARERADRINADPKRLREDDGHRRD